MELLFVMLESKVARSIANPVAGVDALMIDSTRRWEASRRKACQPATQTLITLLLLQDGTFASLCDKRASERAMSCEQISWPNAANRKWREQGQLGIL